MPPSPQTAIVLTGIYMAVHLYNLAAVNLELSAMLFVGRSGTTTIDPAQHAGGRILLDTQWIRSRGCRGKAVAVQIDERTFIVPPETISQITVSDSVAVERNGDGWLRIPDMLGCPGHPVAAESTRLRPGFDDVDALILWAESGSPTTNAAVARRLIATRSHADCRTENTVKRCPLDPIGPERIEVVYGDPARTMASGLPLYAVCRITPSHGGCEVTDIRSDGIGYRALTGENLSSATIQRIDGAIQSWVDQHLYPDVAETGIPL
jgi:hypothetical protein